MALIKCSECGREVSDQAENCPHCGASVPQPMSRWKILVAGVFALAVGMAIFKDDRPPPPPAARPTAAEIQTEKDFQTVVAGARWIKGSMKNPASFELVSALMIGHDVVCYKYRGTNSFNAIVPNYRVITNTVNSGSDKDWNRYCAGKPGTDYSYASHAM
jgi:hypothetical protein